MAVAPWIVSDELWELVEPLLPKKERRFRYPGRKRLADRQALQGILFVLQTGIAWRHLPLELGCAVADSSHVQAKKGARKRARARLIEGETGRSTTSWSTRPGSRSPGRSRAATATTSPS